MHKLLKYSLTFCVVIVLTSVAFYFWASSANHSPADYSQLIENDYPAVADEDSVYSIINYNIM